MANTIEVKYQGTSTTKSLPVSLTLESFVDDPKQVAVNGNVNTTVLEIDLSSLINGIISRLSDQTGKGIKCYISPKTNRAYFSIDSRGDSDDFSSFDF